MLADYGKLHVSSVDYAVIRPDSVDTAVRDWRTALSGGGALRIRGTGHSLSGASLPRAGETLVCTRGLDHYRIEAPGSITVGSGAILWDIRDFVAGLGYVLPLYNGGWAGPSLGGFVSAGGLGLRVPPNEREKRSDATVPASMNETHASSLSEQYGGLWAQVTRLRLVDGLGTVHDIRAGDDEFPWTFASMGLFGLILEVTLRLYPRVGAVDRLAPGDAGRIPVSNPLNPQETDAVAPAQGMDWLYWFTALTPTTEENAAWVVIGDWSHSHRDTLRPTGGWVGPIQNGSHIGFRYHVRRKAPTPPLLYPRDEDFVALGVMAVCPGVGTDASDTALVEAERAFVDQVLEHGWALYCQAENLTRSLDYPSYLGPERWARFCELKARFDPRHRINAGEMSPDPGRSPMTAMRRRRLSARIRRYVGLD